LFLLQLAEQYPKSKHQIGSYRTVATPALQIAEELYIDPIFHQEKSGKKRQLFDYEAKTANDLVIPD